MPSLIPQAEAIADKFHIAFQLFAKCHRVYNSSALLNDSEVDDLSKHKIMYYIMYNYTLHITRR